MRVDDRRAVGALGVILVVFLALCWLYATRVPKWNAPDEPAHYNYVRHLAETGTLPVLQVGDYNMRELEARMSAHFPDSMPVDWIRYESHQPPLYYALATPVYLATQHLSVDRRVLALRLFTSLIGAAAVALTFVAARQLTPERPAIAAGAAGIVAFVPMFVAISAAVENDALATAVVTGTLALLLTGLRRPGGRWYDLAVGVLVGLAFLTKVVAYVVVLLVALCYVLVEVRLRPQPGGCGRRAIGLMRRLGVVVGVSALISGWWFVRNALVYGGLDIFGLRRHDLVVVGQPLTGAIDGEMVRRLLLTAFRSFWAQFGWMGVTVDDRIYSALGVLVVVAVAGLVWGAMLAFARPGRSDAAVLVGSVGLWATFLFVVAATVVYNLTYLQPQGRYLFPALMPIGYGLALGLATWAPGRFAPLLLLATGSALAALTYICLVRFVTPYFAG